MPTYICSLCTRDISRKRASVAEILYCSPRCKRKAERPARKTTRSKIELFIESRLKDEYPKVQVSYNCVSEIGLELDIYFPEHKIAVELNGIFHYQPIFGGRSLYRTQRNDARKRERCKRKGISLFVIDISQIKKFTDEVNEELYQVILCQLGL